MAKFYLETGKQRAIIDAPNTLRAAKKALKMWDGRKLERLMRISEVGFEYEAHPDHDQDAVLTTAWVKAKVKGI